MIEYISHEYFPDDEYTKELVYLQIDGKRFGYVSKMTKNGGLFWDEISVGVKCNGEKKYFKAFKFDSQFLRDDILAFLKARSWENRQVAITPLGNHATAGTTPYSVAAPQYQQTDFLDPGEPPF